MTKKLLPILAAAALTTAVTVPSAQAGADVDLRHQPSFEIVGARAFDFTGEELAPAGDVNGDGIDDVLVSSGTTSPLGRKKAGAVYVVFGRRRTRAAVRARPAAKIAMAGGGAQGFAIFGAHPGDEIGNAIASAGDVDGDGIDDLVVSSGEGAPVAIAPHGVPSIPMGSTGVVYVIYGSRHPRAVDLAHLGVQGVRITNDVPLTFQLGTSVAGGRDVNGDGHPDVVISDYATAPDYTGVTSPADLPPANPSHAYVVFGGRRGLLAHPGASFAISTLGTGGYVLEGDWVNHVSLAADMNGDHRAEVVLATGTPLPGGDTQAGVVAFGRAAGGGGPVPLGALPPADGFELRATGQLNQPPQMSGGGDTNGDGRGDLVAVSHVVLGGQRYAGTVDVVHGAPSGDPVYLDRPSARLLTAVGPSVPSVRTPDGIVDPGGGPSPIAAAAIVGDLDGDGREDVLAGGMWSPKDRPAAGSAWVFRGRSSSGRIALTGPRRGSTVRIDGAYAQDMIGIAAQGAGDFNGDGRPDLLIGGPNATRDGRLRSGAAWVLTGIAP